MFERERKEERKEGRERGKERERQTSAECGEGVISRHFRFKCLCAAFLKCIFGVGHRTKIWGGAALKRLLVA